MRRAIFLAMLAVCLVAGSAAAGRAGRTVDRAYQTLEVNPGGSIYSSSAVTFRTRSQERFLTVTIQDDSGLAIPARITQDADDDGELETEHSFCGSTPESVAVEPGVPVIVRMQHGSCNGLDDPTSVGAWTTGTITATFTR